MFFIHLISFALILIYDVGCNQIPVIQKSPGTSNVIAGEKFKISCPLASGSSPIKFAWYKDDQILVSGKRVQIKSFEEDNSVLTINKIDPADAGSYKCVAANAIGSDFNVVRIFVKGESKQVGEGQSKDNDETFCLQQNIRPGK